VKSLLLWRPGPTKRTSGSSAHDRFRGPEWPGSTYERMYAEGKDSVRRDPRLR
jgi:hypothetical protein